MTAPLAQYPFDLQIEKFNNRMILTTSIEQAKLFLTVEENAKNPPNENEPKSLNYYKRLSNEARLTNNYFTQQANTPPNAPSPQNKPHPFKNTSSN